LARILLTNTDIGVRRRLRFEERALATRPNALPLDILLIDDSAVEVRLIRQILVASKLKNRVHVVGDGTEAMAYLRGEPPYLDVPVPGLVILDLERPASAGYELWKAIRREQKFADLPVVLLVESLEATDLARQFSPDADLLLLKPISTDKLLGVVRRVGSLSLMIMSDRV
jgi:CheY-like chemotaxis protein